MQVRIEDVSPVEKKLFVEIPWATVSEKLGDAYRELGKGVALKGFRKGKVPRPVLEQVYGQRVHAEVAYQLVRESFFRASEEHSLAAVAEPRVGPPPRAGGVWGAGGPGGGRVPGGAGVFLRGARGAQPRGGGRASGRGGHAD